MQTSQYLWKLHSLFSYQTGSLIAPPLDLHHSWTHGESMLNTKHLEPPSLR